MRSVFLWRMLVVLTITILLASLLVTGGYMYLSRDAYTAIKLQELTPKSEAVGQLLAEYDSGELAADAFIRLADKILRASDATGIITDAGGTFLYNSVEIAQASEQYLKALDEQIDDALSGQGTMREDIRTADNRLALSICVPVKDQTGAIIGSVFLLKNAEEIAATTQRLNNTLLLTVAVVLPIMLLLSSFSVRRLAGPLHEMGEVAIKMSKGNFTIRADENEVGEMGLLARALNNLCDTLSQTIYQLRAEKTQLDHMLSSFSEGIAATDSVGVLTHYNPALMRMFGSVRVNSRMELIPDTSIWEAFDEVYSTGEPKQIRYPLSGDRMLWITITPVVTEEGERTGVVGLFRDMTEMERLERTRREYVANVSHELRTPLTAVRGLLEPLADGMVQSEEDRQRYYRIMLREVMRLSRLITDMLQLSRLQSGTEYMELAEVDISEILEDIRQSYVKEAAQRGIRLELCAPRLPHVLTDADRVEQLLVILLDNAMRYTPEGGSIMLAGEDGPRVNISVSDTGSGIPEEDLPYVFDRFYKVDKSRKEGGTGLGLSIARHLIEKLGEKIAVESRLGEGTCFRFTLKKYVSNAIALGPPSEDWDAALDEPLSVWPQELEAEEHTGRTQDAPYEVIPPKEKEKRHDRKKPRKPDKANKEDKRAVQEEKEGESDQ
ncbi:MAG: ATP-binding protein [Bacillota bacterium]